MDRTRPFSNTLRVVACALLPIGALAAPSEPNFETATRWWPDMENVWTPIGWKDHPLRFNVLYNGILLGDPVRQRSWGNGVQLTFIPSVDGVPPAATGAEPFSLSKQDRGLGHQGWEAERTTPVLWTEWKQDGLTLRATMFGHLAGGAAVKTAKEPLFAWVRLSISEIETVHRNARYHWLIKINRPHLRTSMWRDRNLIVEPAQAAYPAKLTGEASETEFRLIDAGGKVRLGIVPREGNSVNLLKQVENDPNRFLQIEMPRKKSVQADLLVPLLPLEREAFDAELKVGFEKALQQSDRFWKKNMDQVARIETPEPLVNQAFRLSPKFAEMIAEKDPGSGDHSLLSGSWHYEKLWATPTSMNLTMILDLLGHHSTAEKYLEIFKTHQGTRKPPGGRFEMHPGYLSTPKTLTSIDWLTDHGAILYAICHHGLLTGDRRFIAAWTPAILKGCEFIRDARNLRGHGGVEGLLPPAVPTDTEVQVQAVWSDGWNYKGLVSAVRLLERIRHPRAEEFSRLAEDYKQTFHEALRKAAQRTPQWTDSAGRQHHLVPAALPDGGDLQHQFYLDTGPLFLVYSGLVSEEDELMQSALAYFREGPNTKLYDLKGNWDQPISLRHEISSCEPCYSWNVYHSHQRGDREHYLEGMYSLFAGALSRQTSIGCEHRGGVSGTLFSSCLPLELARLAVIDDNLMPDELHLLRIVPLAWVSADKATSFERIPTEFGPVSLRFQLRQRGRQLVVSFKPEFRQRPKQVLLHVPPLDGIEEVRVNRRTIKVRAGEVLAVN